MRKSITFALLTFLTLCLTSCDAVEFIFKAGMIWAFLIIAVVAGVIIWLVNKFKSKK